MKLNYKSFGNGPAIIILHGLFGSLDNWITHGKSLASTFSVFLVDQRNHGKSPHHDQWDYTTMAEDLHDFMEQEGIFISHILGHSMGGKTAMKFASMYPQMIDRLVVADMGLKKNPPVHTGILGALTQLDLDQISSRKDAEKILAEQIHDTAIRQFLLKNLSRNSEGSFNWKFNLQVINENYQNVLEAVQTDHPYENPTLFIRGGKSNYILDEDIPNIRKAFPGAVFKEIPNAGHWLHAEAAEEFIRILREFLE